MEARIDIGEIDVPLIKVSQKATMEVDSFKDQKFDGIVTEVADSANNNDTSATSTASTSTDATKFQVKIRISQKDAFLPGMSVTADVQTRYRSNVLTVPIQSVTTWVPPTNNAATNLPAIAAETNAGTNLYVTGLGTNGGGANSTNQNNKPDEPPKPIEVVFVVQGDHVKMVPVKRGISDDNYVEILEGPHEGDQVVSGGYKAINRDLEDGKKVILNTQIAGQDKEPKTY
jgi:HlyD family secretion protein